MRIRTTYSTFIIFAILLLISATAMLFDIFLPRCAEGFDTVPLATNPATKKIIRGYYQVDEENMAILPYGFAVDPNNSRQIVPVTKTAISMLKPTYVPQIPKPGDPLPTKFYFATDASLAVLPPNMKPNIKSIDFSGNPPPSIQIYYNKGYVSETQYYKNQYKPANYPPELPEGVYYVDASHTLVSFLKYGEIPDKSKGYGKTTNPNLYLSAKNFNYMTSNYRDVSNNYDMIFHDDPETIIKQNNLYDLEYGELLVKDQSGNIIILPKTNSQGSVTFYQPGEFPFGASKYVPNYEDSVYLSSIGYRTRFGGNTNASSIGCGDMCKAYNEFKDVMDKNCIKIK
jgi:hypothetical protein